MYGTSLLYLKSFIILTNRLVGVSLIFWDVSRVSIVAQALHDWSPTFGRSCAGTPWLQLGTLFVADASVRATRRELEGLTSPTPPPPMGAGGLAFAHAVLVCQGSPSATKGGPFGEASSLAFCKPLTPHPATAPFSGDISVLSVAVRARVFPKSGGHQHPNLG